MTYLSHTINRNRKEKKRKRNINIDLAVVASQWSKVAVHDTGEESVDRSRGVSTETDKGNRIKIGGGNRLVKKDVSRDVGGTVVSEDEVEEIMWVEDLVEVVEVGDGTVEECMEVVMGRQRREPKPLCRLLELREYLAREGMERRVPEAFTVTVGGVKVPQNFCEAMKDLDLWWAPMLKEFNMIRAHRVYGLVERPLGTNVIGTKWVYIPKFDGNGGLLDRKARIVVQGFSQIQEVDFESTYAATCYDSPWTGLLTSGDGGCH